MSNYNNSEYRINRGFILFISEKKCCLNKCENAAHEVHHINRNNRDHNPFNLIPLCKPHHKVVHLMVVDFGFWNRKLMRLMSKKLKKMRYK